MKKELLFKILDVFKVKDEYFAIFESGWLSSDGSEWFYLTVRGCLFPDQLERLRELVYIGSICVFHGDIRITCKC